MPGQKPVPQEHLLDSTYEQALLTHGAVRLVIMGDSPYEENDGPTGVPFMTDDWIKMRNPVCSGQYVIQSVTGDWIYTIAQLQLAPTPTAYATVSLLRQYNVGLLNARYVNVSEGDIDARMPKKKLSKKGKKALRKQIRHKLVSERIEHDWTNTNSKVLSQLAKKRPLVIVLCVKTVQDTLGPRISQIKGAKVEHAPHPSLFNVQSATRYATWRKHWDVGQYKTYVIAQPAATKTTKK